MVWKLGSNRRAGRERQRKHEELAAANSEGLKDLCLRTLVRVQGGEVTGLAIIEARGQKDDHASASGAFVDNLGHLERMLYAFVDFASQRSAKEKQS